MKSLVRPEFPNASVGSSQALTAAVENSEPLATRPQSTYKSGKAVQTSGATSTGTCDFTLIRRRARAANNLWTISDRQ